MVSSSRNIYLIFCMGNIQLFDERISKKMASLAQYGVKEAGRPPISVLQQALPRGGCRCPGF